MLLLAQQSYASRDGKALIAIGGELERREVYDPAWSLLADAPIITQLPETREWDGRVIPEGTLLVRRRIRHLGAELRMARFVVPASLRALKVVVATEGRLVSLLARSFPEVQIIDREAPFVPLEPVWHASYERLAEFFGRDENAIRQSWRPLAAMSASQSSHCGPPKIGIAWHSVNVRKALPEIADWRDLLRGKNVQFVSLQYNEEDAGFQQLAEASRYPMMSSSPIDQLKDLDGFATQVAAMQGVLTISNTTAHMAGALGIPCVVVLDDIQHLTWPIGTNETPFYPNLRVVRQRGEGWSSVLEIAFQQLLQMIGQK